MGIVHIIFHYNMIYCAGQRSISFCPRYCVRDYPQSEKKNEKKNSCNENDYINGFKIISPFTKLQSTLLHPNLVKHNYSQSC